MPSISSDVRPVDIVGTSTPCVVYMLVNTRPLFPTLELT